MDPHSNPILAVPLRPILLPGGMDDGGNAGKYEGKTRRSTFS
jgi:hypothetical protein